MTQQQAREWISMLPTVISDKVLLDDRFFCWLWIGSRTEDGYGSLSFDRKTYRAHRWIYERLVEPIPSDLTIDHLCRNRACVNPLHLDPCTDAENILRGFSFSAINARKTHCPKGHPYSGSNLGFVKSKYQATNRICRQCARDRARCYQQQKAAASKAATA